MKLIMTLLVRDEIDIIRENIDFHLNMGVDHIIATDNGSVDGTRELLEGYARTKNLTLIDEPGRDYSQWKWVTRMCKIAKHQHDADWIINNDADEFWIPKHGSLKDRLASLDAGVVIFPRVNLITSLESLDSPAHWSERLTIRVSAPTPVPELNDQINDPLPVPYFYLRLPGKAALQAEGIQSVHQGNHSADYDRQVRTETSQDITIYHFPVRSTLQFEKKVHQGGTAYAQNNELHRTIGWHWRRWINMQKTLGSRYALRDALPSKIVLDRDLNSGDVNIDHTARNALSSVL